MQWLFLNSTVHSCLFMSKRSCEAAESIEDAVHDNRMFAKRTFYCIANGAGELCKL